MGKLVLTTYDISPQCHFDTYAGLLLIVPGGREKTYFSSFSVVDSKEDVSVYKGTNKKLHFTFNLSNILHK